MLELKFSKTLKIPKYTWVQVIFPRLKNKNEGNGGKG